MKRKTRMTKPVDKEQQPRRRYAGPTLVKRDKLARLTGSDSVAPSAIAPDGNGR